jgi:hypothetical protein
MNPGTNEPRNEPRDEPPTEGEQHSMRLDGFADVAEPAEIDRARI